VERCTWEGGNVSGMVNENSGENRWGEGEKSLALLFHGEGESAGKGKPETTKKSSSLHLQRGKKR